MMHKIYSQTKEVQASANYHLLEAMQDVEELDWARFGRAVREAIKYSHAQKENFQTEGQNPG